MIVSVQLFLLLYHLFAAFTLCSTENETESKLPENPATYEKHETNASSETIKGPGRQKLEEKNDSDPYYVALFEVQQRPRAGGKISDEETGGNFPNRFCDGCIISENFVLTAASCVFYKLASKLKVIAGQESLKPFVDNTQSRRVKRLIIHDKYGGLKRQRNDISIVEVENPFNFNNFIQAIALPQKLPPFVGQTCMLNGWSMAELFPFTDYFRKVKVKIMPLTQCDISFTFLVEGMLCGSSSNSKSCLGVHGAPLICRGHLQGIVSFAANNTESSCPDKIIYTKVIHYKYWIRHHALLKIERSYDAATNNLSIRKNSTILLLIVSKLYLYVAVMRILRK